MTTMHTSPTNFDTHRAYYAPYTEQIRLRMENDEEILRTISTLEADAKVTASNASQAVYQAQQALVAAHAWMAAAVATYDSYRLEHLRLLDAVTKSRALLHLPPSLPDELIIEIGQLCLDEYRSKIHDEMTRRDGERAEAKDIASLSWIYPFTLSQVCQRWRRAVIGCPRLWAYKENSYRQLSSRLANLISLRAQACSLDVFWDMNAEDPPSIPADFHRWRSARLILTKTTAEPFPFTTTQQYYTLTSLNLASCRGIRAPIFTSRHLSLMPMLSKLTLTDVQFVAPPPHIHSSPMDLYIRYQKVISFRARDMADIAMVFPRLRSFLLDIRGPYINNANGQSHTLSRSASINNLNTSNLPFSFPELERLDISAKDLSHSLVRMQSGNMPKLSYLRLRDNILSTASAFITHLERTGVTFQTLSLSDVTPSGLRGFSIPRSVHTLEIELERATIEALQQLIEPSQLISPVTFSPTSQLRGTNFPFPSISSLSLLPYTGTEVRRGRTEAALLLAVARIVRERNLAVTEPRLFEASAASPMASAASLNSGANVAPSAASTSGKATSTTALSPVTLSRSPSSASAAPSSTSVAVPPFRDSPAPSEVITLKPILIDSPRLKPRTLTKSPKSKSLLLSPRARSSSLSSPKMENTALPMRTTRENSKSSTTSGTNGMSSEDALVDPLDSGDSSGGSSSLIRSRKSPTPTLSPKASKSSLRDPYWLSSQNQQSLHALQAQPTSQAQQSQANTSNQTDTSTSPGQGLSNSTNAGSSEEGVSIIHAGVTPILNVVYTPQTSKGRAAMEDVYKLLVEVRNQWKALGGMEATPLTWGNTRAG